MKDMTVMIALDDMDVKMKLEKKGIVVCMVLMVDKKIVVGRKLIVGKKILLRLVVLKLMVCKLLVKVVVFVKFICKCVVLKLVKVAKDEIEETVKIEESVNEDLLDDSDD